MASNSTLQHAIAQTIAMSDNSQSPVPNTAKPSRIGSPRATKRPCCVAWQRTFDAFLCLPAGRAAAARSGTRVAAQAVMPALRHEGKSPEKALPPTPLPPKYPPPPTGTSR
jgi:hypothetical protein